MKIGVLALQGAFIEHERMLQRLGADVFEIRQPDDICSMDGLVLPGGESTTQLKLLTDLDMLLSVRKLIAGGLPVFGTCAGLILLAKKVEGENFDRISTMNITVRRNAYGRQTGSFFTEDTFAGIDGKIPMTFIRAPYIEQAGEGAEVLATVGGHIVASRQANQLVTAFHPELNADTRVHAYFLDMVKNA